MFSRGFAEKAEQAGGEVVETLLKGKLAAAFALGNLAGGVGTGEDVQNPVSRLGEEADEELRQLCGEACGVSFGFHSLAAAQVAAVGLGIRDLQQVGGDRAAVVLAETGTSPVAKTSTTRKSPCGSWRSMGSQFLSEETIHRTFKPALPANSRAPFSRHGR